MIFDFLRRTKSHDNLAKQPNIVLFSKFLELFFVLKNTPHKVKNSKPDVITIFWGDAL